MLTVGSKDNKPIKIIKLPEHQLYKTREKLTELLQKESDF